MTKIVYQFDEQGYFLFKTEADESPLEPGVFLFPRNTTETKPPEVDQHQTVRWTSTEWVIEDVFFETPVNKLIDFLFDNPDVWTYINNELNAKYSSKGLSNGLPD